MIVYADVLFLLNFSMDYLILHLVSCGLHKGNHLFLCALLGGFYGIAAVKFSMLGLPVFQMLFGGLLVGIAYRPEGILQFLKAFFLFMITSCLIGGMLYAILSARGQGKIINGCIYFDFSLIQFILFTLLCWVGLTVGTAVFGRIRYHCMRKVMIENRGEQVTLTALLDTGCELEEPLTGFPVMVAEYDSVDEILSKELRGMMMGEYIGPIPEKIYQIPFSTVKDGKGMMLAFRPERVTVIAGKKRMVLNRVLVGVVQKKLTGDQSYSALLHQAMTI